MERELKRGDPVIYRLTKRSTHPGPRAVNIHPAPHGDTYTYCVDKYWRVKKVMEDNKVLLYTRRGKEHVCDQDDANLIQPGMIRKIVFSKRFPEPLS